MRSQKKVYGFVIAITDLPTTVETLWSTSRDFFNKNPSLVARNNSMNFILNGGKDGDYNLCWSYLGDINSWTFGDGHQTKRTFWVWHRYIGHFWSNFEIASLNWFRDSNYTEYFDHLDAAGGFFHERWGDAPVHSIAWVVVWWQFPVIVTPESNIPLCSASVMLDRDQIHRFDDIGEWSLN